MRCVLPLALTLLAVQAVHGGETNATIIADSVEVRSGKGIIGPGAYYGTSIFLRKNDRVNVEKLVPDNGCYAIEPPDGSFDLVAKSDVTHGIIGRRKINKDGVLVLIGGKPADPQYLFSQAPKRLNKGAEITLLEPPNEGEYFRIRPEYSVRWIPADAVRLDANAQDNSGPPGLTPPGFNQPPDADTAGKIEQAERLYRQAQGNGQAADWTAAQQLYLELAQSANPEVRLKAVNRLEFIRLHLLEGQGYVNNSTTASPAGYQRPTRPGSSYTYGPDGSPSRYVTPSQLPPSPRPAPPVNNQLRNYPPPSNVATKEFGQLVRTNSNIIGRPLYYLQDGQGNRKCWVVPADGVSLDPYVGRNVTVSSTRQLSYHADLAGYLMTASQVTLMGQ